MQQLIIYLHERGEEHACWLLIDESGTVQQSAQGALSADVTTAARKVDSVTVLLPAEDILLTQVKLPEMSRNKLMQAIPYALEEQLLDEVEGLHFAVAPRQADGSIPVAVISQSLLEHYLQQLADKGIEPDVITSVIFSLPVDETSWYGLLDKQLILRVAEFKGFSCEPENFETFYEIVQQRSIKKPQKLVLYSDRASDASSLRSRSNALDLEVEKEASWLSSMFSTLNQYPVINLRQGVFAQQRSGFTMMNQAHKWIVYAAFALLAVLLLYPLGSYTVLQSRANSLRADIHHIYEKHFPGSKVNISPRLRMEDKLRRFQAGETESQLFILLGYVAESMPANIQLKAFQYQNKLLNLQILANNSEALENFAKSLTAKGLKVRQKNVNVTDNAVTATLEIG